MRCALVLGLGLLISLLAACGSVEALPTRVRERFEAPQPQVRSYAAEQPAAFAAALRAVKRLGFTVSRSGAAQGLVRAHSRLMSGDGFGKARQHTIEVRLDPVGPVACDVAVIIREQEESESFAGATDLPLRNHFLYDSFFGALDAELGVKGSALAPAPARNP